MSLSCTLHPAPCTLHPAPCTLHPAPCTLHPAPCTLHPAPCTLEPAPEPGPVWIWRPPRWRRGTRSQLRPVPLPEPCPAPIKKQAIGQTHKLLVKKIQFLVELQARILEEVARGQFARQFFSKANTAATGSLETIHHFLLTGVDAIKRNKVSLKFSQSLASASRNQVNRRRDTNLLTE